MAGKKPIEMDDFFSKEKAPAAVEKKKSGIFGGLFAAKKKEPAAPPSPIVSSPHKSTPMAASSLQATKSYKASKSPVGNSTNGLPGDNNFDVGTSDRPISTPPTPSKAAATSNLPVPNPNSAQSLGGMVANRVKSIKDPRPVDSPIAVQKKELTVDTRAAEIKAPPSPSPVSTDSGAKDELKSPKSISIGPMGSPTAGSSQALGAIVAARAKSTKFGEGVLPSAVDTARSSPSPAPSSAEPKLADSVRSSPLSPSSSKTPAADVKPVEVKPNTDSARSSPAPPTPKSQPDAKPVDAAKSADSSLKSSSSLSPSPAESKPPPSAAKPAGETSRSASPVHLPLAEAASSSNPSAKPAGPVIITMAPRPMSMRPLSPPGAESAPRAESAPSVTLPTATAPMPVPDSNSAQSLGGMVASRAKAQQQSGGDVVDVEKKVAIAPWLVQDESLAGKKLGEDTSAMDPSLKAKVAPWLAMGAPPEPEPEPEAPRPRTPPAPAPERVSPPTVGASKGAIEMDVFFGGETKNAKAADDDVNLGFDDEGVENPLLSPTGSSNRGQPEEISLATATQAGSTKGTKWFTSMRREASDSVHSVDSAPSPSTKTSASRSPASAAKQAHPIAAAAAASSTAAVKSGVSMTDYDVVFGGGRKEKEKAESVFDTDPELRDVEEFSWS